MSPKSLSLSDQSFEHAIEEQDDDGGCGFQSIIISLMDSFHDKAEALGGVYRESG